MTLSIEDRTQLVKHYIEKAESSREDISFLIENKKLFLAVNRMYYGIYYALSSLAVKYHFSTSKHAQLIGWFNKKFDDLFKKMKMTINEIKKLL